MMWKRIKGILESAALDPEKLAPPKSLWFNDKELEAWFEGRSRLREQKWKAED